MTAFLKKVESIRQGMGDRESCNISSMSPMIIFLEAMDERCSMGSIISPRHLDRIDDMIVRRQSGTILTGGQRMVGKSFLDEFDFSRGSFYPPTVITDVDIEHELWQEEIFGPVVVMKKFTVSYIHMTMQEDSPTLTSPPRLKLRESNLPILLSTHWGRESGLRMCQEHIVLLLTSKLVLSGSIHITAMIPAHHGE